jgi:hypothetical protein
VERLRELGSVEGRNVEIDYRWAVARPARYNENLKKAKALGLELPPTLYPGHAVGRSFDLRAARGM